MINQYPAWKHALIAVALVAGVFFALPNLFGEDPAVQVSAARGAPIDEALRDRVTDRIETSGIASKGAEVTDRLLIRFGSAEDQLRAREIVEDELNRQYVVALNLAPATPDWLAALGAQPMYLGLDLRGGVHFLMEVDLAGAVRQAEQRYAGDLRSLLREEKLRQRAITVRANGGLIVRFNDAGHRDRAYDLVRLRMPELIVESTVNVGDPVLDIQLGEPAKREIERFAVQQNVTTLRNRVNELGVAEPVIQKQGENRIVVQLPGVQDTVRAKEILGATATLEFRMVHNESATALATGRTPGTAKLYHERNGAPILLQRSVMLTGEYITDAASGIDQQSGSPAVFITLDGKGARLFSDRTRDKIGRAMGVVYIEHKSFTEIVDGVRQRRKEIVEEVNQRRDDSRPTRKAVPDHGSRQHRGKPAISPCCCAPAPLAAPIEIVEERTVGPSLGQANIDQGFRSVVIGFVLVLALMAVYYKRFGARRPIWLSRSIWSWWWRCCRCCRRP